MKLLVLNYRDWGHPLAGGAEMHLHRIFGGLASLGHEILLWVPSYAGAPAEDRMDGMRVMRTGSDYSFNLKVALGLRRVVRDFQPDLIVEDLNKLPFYTPLLTRVPKCIQIHHLWGASIFREAFFPIALMVWLHERLIPIFYRRCSFAVVSASTRRELTAMGIPAAQISLIHNGAEEEWAALEPQREKGDYFLWLGRLRRYKGVWVALKAFHQLVARRPHARLIFAGGGPEEGPLRLAVEKWGLRDCVQITGPVTHERKRELLRGALGLVQSSWKEGWGLTVIEAGACGTLSLASRVAGLQDSVVDGRTGFLFPAGDSKALAALMERVLQHPDERRMLESEARTWARSFSWERAIRETSDWLHSSLKSFGGKGCS